MAVEVVVPGLGLGWNSGRIAEWYQPDGAPVSRGDLVFCLESDNVAIDVEAESDGVLRHSPVAGEALGPGEVVALILEPGERLPEDFGYSVASQPEAEQPWHGQDWDAEASNEAPANHVVEDSAKFEAEASDEDAFDFGAALPSYGHAAEEPEPEAPPLLPLRRSTLPPPPPVDEESPWAPIPGDGVAVGGAWNQAPDEWQGGEARDEWSQEPGEPPLKDHREDPRAYFDIAPLAEGVTAMEPEPDDSADFFAAPEPAVQGPRFDAAWDQTDLWVSAGESAPPAPMATPLTMRVRVDLREARKMQAQLAREWGKLAPSDEDVLLRSLAHALREADHGETVALVVPEREGERSSVVAATARFRDAVEALHAGWDAVEADYDCALTSFARAGLDEATPILPPGHTFALTTGAARDWTVVEGERAEAVPMVTLSLAYDPARATAGEAAWLLGRIRELVEAPYVLLAA